MSIQLFLKNNINLLPPRLGLLINQIPYEYRPVISDVYKKRKKEIKLFAKLNDVEKKDFIFNRMKTIIDYSYKNIPFYNSLYKEKGFNPRSHFKRLEDIDNVPIITKSMLQSCDLEHRSSEQKRRYVVNTGGSSGTPLSIYRVPSSMGHEQSHMHKIWDLANYSTSDIKLVFGGRSNISKLIDYDVVNNSFAVDIYADYAEVSKKLKIILNKYNIKYIHGYPSSIYDFLKYVAENDTELLKLMEAKIKAAFLGSEYPHKMYRDFIEDNLKIKTLSWYGHTERVILAYEKEEKFKYHPFHTYGFAEAIEIDKNQYELVGTNYYNFASPLIRYNTEDVVSNIENLDRLINSFEIKKGRGGEFILDRNKKKINLTGFIFGRHHELFNHSKFIQVKQIKEGDIEIHYVSKQIEENVAANYFDSSNADFEIRFIRRESPYKTKSGKINLLIK